MYFPGDAPPPPRTSELARGWLLRGLHARVTRHPGTGRMIWATEPSPRNRGYDVEVDADVQRVVCKWWEREEFCSVPSLRIFTEVKVPTLDDQDFLIHSHPNFMGKGPWYVHTCVCVCMCAHIHIVWPGIYMN